MREQVIESKRQMQKLTQKQQEKEESWASLYSIQSTVSVRPLPWDESAAQVFLLCILPLRVKQRETDLGDPVCLGQDECPSLHLPQASPGWENNFPPRKLRVLASKRSKQSVVTNARSHILSKFNTSKPKRPALALKGHKFQQKMVFPSFHFYDSLRILLLSILVTGLAL